MFLVSGEAVIRNLMRGHRVAQELGGVMKVGYSPMSYGQPSQIPQIYQGFGIDSIMFYRGMDHYGIKRSEYILEGADGTRLLGIKFGPMPRHNFRFQVFGGTVHDQNNPRILFHTSDADSIQEVYLWMHDRFLDTYNTTWVQAGAKEVKAELASRATTEHLLMMDGFDASYPHPNTAQIVRDAKGYLPNDVMLHGSLPAYIDAVKKSVDWDKLQVVKGERRTPARDTKGTSIMQGILTSHCYLKRSNHDTQTMLEKYAEPLSSFAWLLEHEYPSGYLTLAWKEILANHGHDTICGASVDQIYIDALSRLDQSRMIAHYVSLQSEKLLMESITRRNPESQEQLLTVFNPLPYDRTEVGETFVEFPQEAKVKDFEIVDYSGRPQPYAILDKEKLYGVMESGDCGYSAYFVDRYRIAFAPESVPSLGYKCFRVVPKGRESILGPSLSKGAAGMENEFLKVAINVNGTLNVTHKATGRTYKDLGYFESGGDAGDPWHYVRPKEDSFVTTLKSKASIKRVEDSPLQCTYRVKVSMKAPEALNPDKVGRTKKTETVSFDSLIRLTAGSPCVEIKTRVDTPLQDQRLRVKFPSGVQTDASYSEGNFDVLKRAIVPTTDMTGWVDSEYGIQPQQSFVDLTDGKAGLAVLNKGLREYEIEQDSKRTIALTLVRGIRYPKVAGGANPFDDDPDQRRCQCQGQFDFDYALCPHEGDWHKAGLIEKARRYNVPMRFTQCTAGLEVIRPEFRFLKLEPPPLVLSALKCCESRDTLIVRVFNPTTRRISAKLTLACQIKKARLVNLNEEPMERLSLDTDHRLRVDVRPKKIVTLELFVEKMELE